MTKINIQTSGGAGPLASGNLQIKNGLPIDATLQIVSDVDGNDSVLKISTEDVTNNGSGGIMSNTAFGDNALIDNTTGSSNTSIGQATLRDNTTGVSNTAIGHESLRFNITGSNNTALGRNGLFDLTSGSNNTSVGQDTGRGITTGSNNTILGAGVTGLSATLANNIIIADGQGNRRINVDNVGFVGIGTTTPAATLDVSGDARFGDGNNFNPLIQFAGSGRVSTSPGYSFVGDLDTGMFNPNLGNTIAFATAASERLRITSAGNVGIGTSAPDDALQINRSLATTGTGIVAKNGITLQNTNATNANYTTIQNLDSTGGQNAQIQFINESHGAPFKGAIAFTSRVEIGNFAERMRIGSDGFVRLTANSGGIQFNGDTAAANALDDYEEGTWTMGVSFGGASVGVTASIKTGTYTKIGRQVTVNGLIVLTSKGSSAGAARITGLPFLIPFNNPFFSAAALKFNKINFANQFQGFGSINTTTILLTEITEAGVETTINGTDFANDSEVIVSFTYFA